MPGYHGGHILRIKMLNFMTYDELEIFPKPGLNLIVGLNGSGKSSIMCAICLGLAGKPQLTGRSTQLSDFVKFGCSEAKIEIELENTSKENVVISRTIKGDKSTWLLNNKVVTLNEIENIVRKFNIDVGNLCQFLPQEKVMEFSKMDKKQRLENMLKAVGDQDLFDTFKELKQIRQQSVKLEEEIKRLQVHKDGEVQEIERLKVEVDKHEEKLRNEEYLKTLEHHKTYLEYHEIKNKLAEVKKGKTAVENQRENVIVRIGKLAEKNNLKTNDLNEVVEQMKTLNEEIFSLQQIILNKDTEIFELLRKGKDAKTHYNCKIFEKEFQDKKLEEIANQIKVLRDLRNEGESQIPLLKEKDEQISQNLDKIRTEISSLSSTKFSLLNEKSKLEKSIKENRKEAKELGIQENQNMELLKKKFKDVYEGVIWLKENVDKFRASVHQPMFLTLKLIQEDKCKFIENHVGSRDLLAFICEDKEDSKLLTRILRLEKNLNVNIVMAPDNPIEYYKSPVLTPELKQLGVIGFLKDVIEAPDTIKRFLCHCYHLHSVPFCSEVAEQNINQLFLSSSEISLVFTPDAKITGKRSKYGNRNLCIRRDQLKIFNFLSCSKDCSEQLRLLETQLKVGKDQLDSVNEKLKSNEMKIKELVIKENSLKEEKKELFRKLQVYSNAENQLNQKINLHEKKEFDLVNEEEEKSKLTDQMQNINKEKRDIFLNMSDTIEKFVKQKKQRLFCNLKARILEKVLSNINKLKSKLEKENQELEKKFEDLCSESKQVRKKGNNLKDIIMPWLTTYEEAKHKGAFSFFSIENKEEITKEIRRVQALIDLNCDENEVVTTDYVQKKEQIAKLDEEIKSYEQRLQEFAAKIKLKKSPWLLLLQNHIQNINSKFSGFYKQLNYSGEIVLDTCNDTDDFLNYGLQITLKYRDNAPLSELSSSYHSGGECSVAAIVFILSLQEFTDIPFRCIDEINQGMDSENERNMYDLIAQSAKSESCLQYFLLTPKLLMNLELIEKKNVAVHVIYNSCFLGVKINVAEHLRFSKKRKADLL